MADTPVDTGTVGVFDLDPCTSLVRPWDTALRHLTIQDDGLQHDWSRLRVWLNPPYTDVQPWLRKMQQGVALLNANTHSSWFHDYIFKMAHAVCFLKGKVNFYRPDGVRGRQGWSGSALVAYSEQDASILHQAGFDGKFVPLVITFSPDVKSTWRRLIRYFLSECGGTATLEQLYEMAAGHPKVAGRKHWKAKVRQTAQRHAERVAPATYKI